MILRALFAWLSNKPDMPARRKLKDVKKGEIVRIEWSIVKGSVASPICVNNDPATKTIWLEITWDNWEEYNRLPKEQLVLDYLDMRLINFSVLNPEIVLAPPVPEETTALETLRNVIKTSLEKEEYEKVRAIKTKLEALIKI